MPGASQALIRSQASSPIGGAYIKTPASPFLPQDVVVSRPHLLEDIEVAPLSGTPQPGGKLQFDLPLEVDSKLFNGIVMGVDVMACCTK